MTLNDLQHRTPRRRGRLIAAALLGALLALPVSAGASAGVLTGSVVATGETAVYATNDGTVSGIDVLEGQTVCTGDALLSVDTVKVFASQDGTVASVEAATGEYTSGTALKLAPESLYEIICTVDDAYDEPENMLVHMGETMYVKCKKDGTHRAIARVKAIDGEQYTLETLGGALYVGEVVYLYSDDEFGSKQKTGIGTVISTAPEEYSAQGCITQMYVAPGDEIERGQLLYEYIPGGDISANAQTQLESTADGIITAINASEGSALKSGDAVFTIAPADGLRISVTVSEADVNSIAVGESVELTLPWGETEDSFSGTVAMISRLDDSAASSSSASSAAAASGMAMEMSASAASDDSDDSTGGYEVLIIPSDAGQLRIGMSITVDFSQDEG